jgi:hypothetical protein
MDKSLLFSKFSSQEFAGVSRTLCEVFSTSESELSSLYRRMSDDFDMQDWPSANFVERDFFRSHDHDFQKIYGRSPVVAVDLPSLLEIDDGKTNKPTVFLVGQDSKSDLDTDQVRIGTPYALHLKNCREKLTRTKLYFDMIYVLIESGYRVYLTDIFKVWVCNPDRPYYGIALPKTDIPRFEDVLRSEIQIMKPVALITWGRKAEYSVVNLKSNIPHYKFLHPGGAAGGAWSRLLGYSPTNINKLEYWRSEILKHLPPVPSEYFAT